MPYTPPSQRSPASTNNSSPTLSRNHSYHNATDSSKLLSPVSPQTRPPLPRSSSAISYLQKHRRSPSISQTNGDSTAETHSLPHHAQDGFSVATNSSVSPQDSGSDDEDRGRQLLELQKTLQSLEMRRNGSPSRDAEKVPVAPVQTAPTTDGPGAAAVPQLTAPVRPGLTPEARKISHSRSSSEIALSTLVNGMAESSLQTSDNDSDEDLAMKPPLLRKKSGELVKPALRPASRRRPSSMPGTPTFSKAVHFNEDIEQVRHFHSVDRPVAVSAGSSPVETYDSESEYPFGYDDGYQSKTVEWEIKLANFPRETFERKAAPVRLERLFLSPDHKTMIGSVACANIAFEKVVIARFTLDYWKTTSEVVAEYNNDVRRKQQNDGYDRFNFNIKLADQANLESKTLLLCVRYNAGGQEYWDNNNNMNFQVDFTKKVVENRGLKVKTQSSGTAAGSLGTVPRSRHSPPSSARPRSMPASAKFDDDFGDALDSRYQFGTPQDLLGESPTSTIRLKSHKGRGRHGSIFPPAARQTTAPGQAFSTRYDFSASLSAALSNAQTVLGDRSGLKIKEPTPKKAAPAPAVSTESTAPAVQPSTAATDDKPDVKSAEYNELIQKYCFFGSNAGSVSVSKKTSPVTSTAPQTTNNDTDGAGDNQSDSNGGSPMSSGSASPPSPVQPVSHVDGANDYRFPTKSSPFQSRSNSPGPLTGSDIFDRKHSPVNFGYPYNQHMSGGIFSHDNNHPTAIRG